MAEYVPHLDSRELRAGSTWALGLVVSCAAVLLPTGYAVAQSSSMPLQVPEAAFDDFKSAVISKDIERIDRLASRIQRDDLTRLDGAQLVEALNGCDFAGVLLPGVADDSIKKLKFACPGRTRSNICETGDQVLMILPTKAGVLAEISEIRKPGSNCAVQPPIPPSPAGNQTHG